MTGNGFSTTVTSQWKQHIHINTYSVKQIADKQPNHNILVFVFVHIVLSIVKLGHTGLRALCYTRRPCSITASRGGGTKNPHCSFCLFFFFCNYFLTLITYYNFKFSTGLNTSLKFQKQQYGSRTVRGSAFHLGSVTVPSAFD